MSTIRVKKGRSVQVNARLGQHHQLFKYPTYSLDLAPSAYYPFLKIKKELGGHHFATECVMDAGAYFLGPKMPASAQKVSTVFMTTD